MVSISDHVSDGPVKPPSMLFIGGVALFIAVAGIIISVCAVVAARILLGYVLPLDIQLLNAMVTMILGVAGCAGYFFGSNFILDRIFADEGPNAATNIATSTAIRPWLFMGPAMVILGLYLVYPVFNSIWISILDSTSQNFVGLANYVWMFGDAKF